MIAVNPGVDIHWGTCTTIWGSPDLDDLPRKPAIAVVAVNNPDGQKLIALARAGRKRDRRHRDDGRLVRAEDPRRRHPGRRGSDRFVLVHGHYDSWDVGVGDNATGDATLLELARVLWAHAGELRRSVRIAWWPGHSTGRYAGSTWFADAFAIDLDENCVAQINCDSARLPLGDELPPDHLHDGSAASCRAGDRGRHRAEAQVQAPEPGRRLLVQQHRLVELLHAQLDDAGRSQGREGLLCGVGLRRQHRLAHRERHAGDRRPPTSSRPTFASTCSRCFAIANAEILPFDWRETVAEFKTTLAGYEAAAADRADLTPARTALDALSERLAELYRAIEAGRVEPGVANEALMRLARMLVPINFTREPRFRHDPAYTVPPLPSLAVAAELARIDASRLGFAKTQLLRGQNRFVAALREAERIAAQALHPSSA